MKRDVFGRGSIVSAIISLSDEPFGAIIYRKGHVGVRKDYVGGGTEFMDGSVYRPSQGSLPGLPPKGYNS